MLIIQSSIKFQYLIHRIETAFFCFEKVDENKHGHLNGGSSFEQQWTMRYGDSNVASLEEILFAVRRSNRLNTLRTAEYHVRINC
jgi:hypothetical protein